MRVVLVGMYPYSPVGLAPATLKAYCDADPSLAGVSTQLAGFVVETPPGEIASAIGAAGGDVAGFSTYIWNQRPVLEAARDLKARWPGTAVVLGGPEVAGQSFDILAGYPFIDFVVSGEGEVTLAQLLGQLGGGGGRDGGRVAACGDGAGDGYAGIPGLTWRRRGAPVVNPPRPPIADLAALPSPFLTGVLDVDRVGPYLFALETYRGCPFGCRYCYWGKSRHVRYFPLERVEAELRAVLQSTRLHRVYLSDPVCNLHRARFKRILRILAEENPNRIIFDFEMIPDTLDEETAALLGRLHDGYVAFGLQSTNPAALAQVGRRWHRGAFEDGWRTLRRGAGRLKLFVDLIYGLPGDDYAGYLASMRYAMSLLPDKIQPHPLQVLPGSDFWAGAANYGLAFDRQAPHLATSSATFSAAEVRRAAAWQTPLYAYFNPAVHVAVAILSTYAAGDDGEPFRVFTRLLRCLRRAVDLELVAREVDVAPAVAARLGDSLAALVGDGLASAGVRPQIIAAARDIVRFHALWSSFAAAAPAWRPPAGWSGVAPADILAVAPENAVARFGHDVTAAGAAELMADPYLCERLPHRPVAVVFNRRLNEPQFLPPALDGLVTLCDGRRAALDVASAFARKNGFTELDAVAPRLLESLSELVRCGVLDVTARGPVTAQ
jgi:radical SAM superfamily enzyme YgiQ (UPF0313 family)